MSYIAALVDAVERVKWTRVIVIGPNVRFPDKAEIIDKS